MDSIFLHFSSRIASLVLGLSGGSHDENQVVPFSGTASGVPRSIQIEMRPSFPP